MRNIINAFHLNKRKVTEHMNKKIIIWSTEVLNLIEGQPIGGIAVQMFFWAQVFVDNGWQVFSLSKSINKRIEKNKIIFFPILNVHRLNLILEWCYSFYYIIRVRPHVIVIRGADRELFPLSVLSQLLNVKLVFFAASDVNFEPGKELINNKFNRWLYQKSIKRIQYIVTQNSYQYNTLKYNYKKDSLMMYNIWGKTESKDIDSVFQFDIAWIANFRRLKRAEWVLSVAEKCNHYCFAMAGGPTNGDKQYYEEIRQKANAINNITFWGPKSFFFTNHIVTHSHVLICTSSFEGFPNTFLQAWSSGIPVISTVDPSGVIVANNLGIVIHSEKELKEALEYILTNHEEYEKKRLCINNYFRNSHSSMTNYNRLMDYLQI